jgi:hypothetical protein
VVTELIDEHRLVIRNINGLHAENGYLVDPAPDGTRLELTYRWPGHAPLGEVTAEDLGAALHEVAKQYRTTVEQPPANLGS